jgi:hypothetical protein
MIFLNILSFFIKILMINLLEVYLCIKQNNDTTYNCEKFDDFNQAIVHFRRRNQAYTYLSIKEFDSTMIPICVFNPLKKLTLQYKLSKVFKDHYIQKEDINIF